MIKSGPPYLEHFYLAVQFLVLLRGDRTLLCLLGWRVVVLAELAIVRRINPRVASFILPGPTALSNAALSSCDNLTLICASAFQLYGAVRSAFISGCHLVHVFKRSGFVDLLAFYQFGQTFESGSSASFQGGLLPFVRYKD